MKDTKLRGIVLSAFYEQRRGDMYCPTPQEFGGIMTERDLASISEQLGEHGLLNWKSIRYLDGNHTGMGRISALGIDVVEGVATPDIKVEFVQSKTINVSGSSNVVVGNNNTMSVSGHVIALGKV